VGLGGIEDHVSGKFRMLTKNDDKFNQYLEINVELKSRQENYPADLKNKDNRRPGWYVKAQE